MEQQPDQRRRSRGPGRPRAVSPEQVRRTALQLFAEHGYRETSLEQVAAAAGISRTTLFAYFPAKRDLVWQELIDHVSTPPPGPRVRPPAAEASVVDLVVDRLLAVGKFPAERREDLALRWRLVIDDEELRAFGRGRAAEVASAIVQEATMMATDSDASLVDHVVHALAAVALRAVEEWARGAGGELDLEEYSRQQLAPVAVALRPLLP